MFGLGGASEKKKKEELFFDLEMELKDPVKMKAMVKKIEERIQKIKGFMRSGGDQEAFNRYNILLQAYNGVLKILSRIKTKK